MRYIYIPLALFAAVMILAALAYPPAALAMFMMDHGFGPITSFTAMLAVIVIPLGLLSAAITKWE